MQLFTTPIQPVAGNTFNYTDADRISKVNFGKLLEPVFRKIFFETYDEKPEQYTKIYKVHTSSKAEEKDWGMGAFGDWTKRTSQFDTVAYKTLSPGLERTYVHSAFTQGFMITREMFDDDKSREMNKMPSAMARSGRAKVEKDAVLPLINGFKGDKTDGTEDAYKIYDGKALFSADGHPLLDKAGVKFVNKLTGKLTDANLKKGLQMMREIVDEAGNLVQFQATKLIIPPALEDVAIRLLGSDRVTGGNLNDTNAFLKQSGLEIVVLDYLGTAGGGNDNYWFLQDGNQHEMNFFWRIRPEFKWDEDFDTFVAKYRGYMRYSMGCSDWRGMIGSDGTTA